MVIIFLGPLFFPLANSKSEGSPVLPHEPSKVKPEESREITRPSRPAVSAFFSRVLSSFHSPENPQGKVVGDVLMTQKQKLLSLLRTGARSIWKEVILD